MNHDALALNKLDIPYMETTKFGDYTIKIAHDDDAESPREWEPTGTMVCWHRNYNLGDKHNFHDTDAMMHELSGLYDEEHTDYLEPEQLARCYKVAGEKNIILPLYLYDHSGISMSVGSFACSWDSGQVGWIYIPYETLRKEHDWKNITEARRKEATKWLEGEVETYDQYLTGNVYGFTIEKGEDDEHVDSCWGFFGYDGKYMIDEIKSYIAHDILNTPQQIEMFG